MNIKPLFLAIVLSSASHVFADVSNEFSIHAAYTYWLAGEEGLGLGRNGNFLEGDDPFFTPTTSYLSQPFEYESGFKVGASWERNNWGLAGDYTWVHNKSSLYSSAPFIDPDLGTGVWLIAPWFSQIAQDGGSLSSTQVGSEWQLKMDIADLALSYRHLLSSHLIFHPYGGLRAAWIRQTLDINIIEPTGLFFSLPPQPIDSFTCSNSWSIGPRFGSKIHAVLGYGIRIEGNLALSLLFTNYTKVFHSEDAPATDTFPGPLYAELKNQHTLRPVLETGLGIGWNGLFNSNRLQVDLSATYDFMLWWNQNMMREFVNSIWNQSPVNGDLYLHGLTVTGRFSF
jgi:hypothetical protein